MVSGSGLTAGIEGIRANNTRSKSQINSANVNQTITMNSKIEKEN